MTKFTQCQSETCFRNAHFSEWHTMPICMNHVSGWHNVSERHATRVRWLINFLRLTFTFMIFFSLNDPHGVPLFGWMTKIFVSGSKPGNNYISFFNWHEEHFRKQSVNENVYCSYYKIIFCVFVHDVFIMFVSKAWTPSGFVMFWWRFLLNVSKSKDTVYKKHTGVCLILT